MGKSAATGGRTGDSMSKSAATGRSTGVSASTSATPSRGRSAGAAMNREEMIAVAAYFRAERRGFSGGDPAADWLAAEAEIDAMLSAPPRTAIH